MRVRYCFFTLTSICFFLGHMASGQFDDLSTQWPIFISGQTAAFGNGLSVYDFDRDGLDDITVAELDQGIGLFRNTGSGFELYHYHVFIGDIKQLVWVDYDNDHDPDLFFTSNGEGIHLLRNEGESVFSDQSFLFDEFAAAFAYGAAWADYNRDGLLDVYVCMYDYPGTSIFPNLLFRQNPDHTFEEAGSSLGVSSATDEAFQPVWIDFDLDGWLDLYVINDHSVPNEYYRNNDGESFTEMAAWNGSNIAQSSMSNSVSDYDNDGDFDVFITDGGAPVLLQNNMGTFTDVAVEAGVGQWANNWSALWIDHDLDGFEDLHVCTENPGNQPDNNFFYVNQQNGVFYEGGFDNTNHDSFCAAKGDFNNDGQWDYAVLNGYPPSLNIWVNNGTAPSVKIELHGTVSNADGVGAFLEYWVNGNKRITQTQCGENYISQNTHAEILATEGFPVIDSINVHWPSGWVDHYESLPADSVYDFTEGETILYLNMYFEYQTCPGDSLLLSVEGDDYFIWENGEAASQRWVYSSGEYFATFTNEFGFEYVHYFEISNWSIPEVVSEVLNPLCANGSDGQISLSIDESLFESYVWSDGEEGLFRNNLMSGQISCELITTNDCPLHLQFELIAPPPLMVLNDLDTTICFNTGASFEPLIGGGISPYEINWPGNDPLNIGEGEHLFEIIDANGCMASFSFIVTWLPEIFLTLNADTVCAGATTDIEYSASGGSGILLVDFGNLDPLHVQPGQYDVVVYDEQLCSATATIEVVQWSEMENTLVITPAENGPNGSAEISTSGGTPPYNYLWDNGETMPAPSNLAQGVYACIITDANGCESEVEAIIIDLDVAEIRNDKQVYPSPFTNQLFVKIDRDAAWWIFDISGKVIANSGIRHGEVLDTTSWPAGNYFFLDQNFNCRKIVKY